MIYYEYCMHSNILQNQNFCIRCFEFYFMQNFCNGTQNREKILVRYFCAEFSFAELFLVDLGLQFVLFLHIFQLFGLLLGGIMRHCGASKRAQGTLDSGIAVHSYTGIQAWISWTLGLQSVEGSSAFRVHPRGRVAKACSENRHSKVCSCLPPKGGMLKLAPPQERSPMAHA